MFRWTVGILLCFFAVAPLAAQSEDAPNLVSAGICSASGSVFAYSESGVYDVFRVDENEMTNLTNDDANDYIAALSPDRTQIAFISDRSGGGVELYLMSPDGQDIRQLTDDGLLKSHFNWSLDSRRIAYAAFHNAGADWQDVFASEESFTGQAGDVFTVDVETGDVTQLTDGFAGIRVVAWNTGRTQIAFAGEYEGVMGLYTVSAEGGDARLIIELNEPVYPSGLYWSLDSRYIAYTASSDSDYRSHIVEVETGSLTELPDDTSEDMPPLFSGWTADSKSIIRLSFSTSSSTPEYELVNIETGEVTPLLEFTSYAFCLENVRAANALLEGDTSTP